MLINLAQTNPQLFILLIFCLMLALTFHEFAHAWVAFLFGDPTAKHMGRMNINPLSHLDLMGGLMLLFVGVGYAKPVPVDPRNFTSRHASFFVAAAGPAMNLLLALFGGILFRLAAAAGLFGSLQFSLDQLLYLFMYINLNLCLFNLLPLGPLDGTHVFSHFLPIHTRRSFLEWNARYGTWILLGAFFISTILPKIGIFSWISIGSRAIVAWMLP